MIELDQEVYPYLLRVLSVERPNQVWSIDLTYIRPADGIVYFTAIIDWYSRKVLSWDLSLTPDKSSGIELLGGALRRTTAYDQVYRNDYASPANMACGTDGAHEAV